MSKAYSQKTEADKLRLHSIQTTYFPAICVMVAPVLGHEQLGDFQRLQLESRFVLQSAQPCLKAAMSQRALDQCKPRLVMGEKLLSVSGRQFLPTDCR